MQNYKKPKLEPLLSMIYLVFTDHACAQREFVTVFVFVHFVYVFMFVYFYLCISAFNDLWEDLGFSVRARAHRAAVKISNQTDLIYSQARAMNVSVKTINHNSTKNPELSLNFPPFSSSEIGFSLVLQKCICRPLFLCLSLAGLQPGNSAINFVRQSLQSQSLPLIQTKDCG